MKARFFRHLLGGADPDAERVYRWHIDQRSGIRMRAGLATDKWKRTLDDYVASAESLCWTMKAFGLPAAFAVQVDPDGELLDGSHRVACALALRMDAITVRHEPRKVWAPPWGYQWFVDHGMGEEDLERLRQDWAALSEHNVPSTSNQRNPSHR